MPAKVARPARVNVTETAGTPCSALPPRRFRHRPGGPSRFVSRSVRRPEAACWAGRTNSRLAAAFRIRANPVEDELPLTTKELRKLLTDFAEQQRNCATVRTCEYLSGPHRRVPTRRFFRISDRWSDVALTDAQLVRTEPLLPGRALGGAEGGGIADMRSRRWHGSTAPARPGRSCLSGSVRGRASMPGCGTGPRREPGSVCSPPLLGVGQASSPTMPPDRGGLSTKIHLASDGRCRPLRSSSLRARRHDAPCLRASHGHAPGSPQARPFAPPPSGGAGGPRRAPPMLAELTCGDGEPGR